MPTFESRFVTLTVAKPTNLNDIIKCTSSSFTATGNSVTVTVPTCVADGDFMVLFVGYSFDPAIPSRYTLYEDSWANQWPRYEGHGWMTGNSFVSGETRGHVVHVCTRIARNEPSEYSFSHHMEGYDTDPWITNPSTVIIACMVILDGRFVVGGQAGATYAINPAFDETPAASTLSVDGFSLSDTNEPIFFVVVNEGNTTTITQPSGMSVICDASAGSGTQSIALYVGMKIATGSTGSFQASFSQATYSAAIAGGFVS